MEFRGGYETYYVAAPAEGKTDVTTADMIANNGRSNCTNMLMAYCF